MIATTKPFDGAVTSPTGDMWLACIGAPANFAPITLNPGQSTTIEVSITPTGAPGTVVRGMLYVDSYLSSVPPGQTTGDELEAFPYTYRIGGAALQVVGAAAARNRSH